jgi:hypothetical protein
MPYTTRLNKELKLGTLHKHRVSLLMKNNNGIGLDHPLSAISYLLMNSVEKEYDMFFVHGYELQEMSQPYLNWSDDGTGTGNKISSENPAFYDIECDTFVIDLMGEHRRESDLETWEKVLTKRNIKYNTIKLIGIYTSDDTIKYKDWKIFKSEFPNLFFISPHNNTYHHWASKQRDYPKERIPSYISEAGRSEEYINTDVYLGTKYVENKPYLFQCLNWSMRPHRISMVHHILQNKLDSMAILSSKEGEHENIKVPEIKIDSILDTDFRWGLKPHFSNNAYIDLVTETEGEIQFNTEKPLNSFLSLQFPIIFGYKGIVEYYRKLGFDMFDDIIDHSYDNMTGTQHKWGDIMNKAKVIADELLRLSELDWHEINKKCKERLLNNQKLINKYNLESKRNHDIVEFIFTDSFDISSESYNTLYL